MFGIENIDILDDEARQIKSMMMTAMMKEAGIPLVLGPTIGPVHEYDELVTVAKSFAQYTMQANGAVPAVYFALYEGFIHVIQALFENKMSEKIASHVMSDMMKELGAKAYVFMSETWIAVEHGDIEDIRKRAKEPGFVQPRDREDREERVLIAAFDKEGRNDWFVYRIKRPDNVLEEDERPANKTASGAWRNLLIQHNA